MFFLKYCPSTLEKIKQLLRERLGEWGCSNRYNTLREIVSETEGWAFSYPKYKIMQTIVIGHK